MFIIIIRFYYWCVCVWLFSNTRSLVYLSPSSSFTVRTSCSVMVTHWRRTSAWALSLSANAAYTKQPTPSMQWRLEPHTVNLPKFCTAVMQVALNDLFFLWHQHYWLGYLSICDCYWWNYILQSTWFLCCFFLNTFWCFVENNWS